MSLNDEIARLKAIRREADAIFKDLETLAKADRKAPPTVLRRLSKAAGELDAAARAAAVKRRAQIIKDLTDRIDQYDVLLSLNLSPAVRASVEAERATLVAQRGYHRGRAGLDFEGIVSQEEVDRLAALITEVNNAVAAKKKAVAYIDGAIRIGIAASKIIAKIAAG